MKTTRLVIIALAALLIMASAAQARPPHRGTRNRAVHGAMKKVMASHAQSVVARANAEYKAADHARVVQSSVRILKVGKRRVQFEGRYSVAFKVPGGEWNSGKTIKMRGTVSRAGLDRMITGKGKAVPTVKEKGRNLKRILASLKSPYDSPVEVAVHKLKNPAEIRKFVNHQKDKHPLENQRVYATVGDWMPKTFDSWALAARAVPNKALPKFGAARPRAVLIPALKKSAGDSNWVMHAIGTLRHPKEIRTLVNHYAAAHPKVAIENMKAYVDGYGSNQAGTTPYWHAALKDAQRWLPYHTMAQ